MSDTKLEGLDQSSISPEEIVEFEKADVIEGTQSQLRELAGEPLEDGPTYRQERRERQERQANERNRN